MTKEELEKETFKLVLIGVDHKVLPEITSKKIMLLINDYTKALEKERDQWKERVIKSPNT